MSKLFSTGHDGTLFEFKGRFNIDLFDELLLWCVENKASDVTIQPDSPVYADIGGKLVMVTNKSLNGPEVEGVAKYIYNADNAVSLINSGRDLDVSHETKTDGKRTRFRINMTGGRKQGGNSLQITARTLPGIPPLLSDLDIEQDIIDNFRPPNGMVIVTGPTGSGKSTLLSSGIRYIIEHEDANEKVLEYSAPIEYVYDKVIAPSSVIFQTEAGKHLRSVKEERERVDFAYCVRNALRRKPTIILIGESRDKETISASVQASLTGHLLYTTMHTTGVAETIRRATIPFSGTEKQSMSVDIMESLRMIVTQILLDKKDGGKVGCREYMIFSPEIRIRYLDTPVDDWLSLTRKIMSEGSAISSTMGNSAHKLFNEGKIEKRILDYILAKSKGGVKV